jgi:uncharacterized protein YPO0396
MDILHGIEAKALALRDDPPAGEWMMIADTAAAIDLPMERPLHTPPIRPSFADAALEAGTGEVDATSLFSQVVIDKAAGADSKERSLRSYVLGHYKSERHELSGTAKPVALRDHNTYSVVLAAFHNAGYDQTVTLALVFWMKELQGQPARFFVATNRALTIAADFAHFGPDIAGLRKRLRGAGAKVFDSFPPYGAWFRRRFGLNEELDRQGAQVTRLAEQAEAQRADNGGDRIERLTEQNVAFLQGRREHEGLCAEIESLKARRSNIPAEQVAMRAGLCRALALTEDAMPFAGELIQVREDDRHRIDDRGERETIKERIARINQSLTQIDYNTGRYIVLRHSPHRMRISAISRPSCAPAPRAA